MNLQEYLVNKKTTVYISADIKSADIKSADECKAYAVKKWFGNKNGCVWISKDKNFAKGPNNLVKDDEISSYHGIDVVEILS